MLSKDHACMSVHTSNNQFLCGEIYDASCSRPRLSSISGKFILTTSI